MRKLVVLCSLISLSLGSFAQQPTAGIVYPVSDVKDSRKVVSAPVAAAPASAASAPTSSPAASSAKPVAQSASRPAAGASAPRGSKVYTATMTGAQAQDEAAVASQMKFPSAITTVTDPNGVVATDVGGAKGLKVTLPTWVGDALDRTANRRELVVTQGVTELVKVARVYPNRFVTPFECAELVTTDGKVDQTTRGGVVTVATNSDDPVGVFLQDCDSDRAIGLTLFPSDIPQRELRLVLDNSWQPVPVKSKQPTSPNTQTTYVDHIKAALRSVAKGEIPDGHVIAPARPELAPDCQIPGVRLTLGQILEGTTDRIAVYLARSASSETVPIQEQGCYRKGVLAVAAFPLPAIAPGESTEVYVIVRKDSLDPSTSSRRRPVLAGAAQ